MEGKRTFSWFSDVRKILITKPKTKGLKFHGHSLASRRNMLSNSQCYLTIKSQGGSC